MWLMAGHVIRQNSNEEEKERKKMIASVWVRRLLSPLHLCGPLLAEAAGFSIELFATDDFWLEGGNDWRHNLVQVYVCEYIHMCVCLYKR